MYNYLFVILLVLAIMIFIGSAVGIVWAFKNIRDNAFFFFVMCATVSTTFIIVWTLFQGDLIWALISIPIGIFGGFIWAFVGGMFYFSYKMKQEQKQLENTDKENVEDNELVLLA